MFSCDFCGKRLATIEGLRSHAIAKHRDEMDANKALEADADREMFGDDVEAYGLENVGCK